MCEHCPPNQCKESCGCSVNDCIVHKEEKMCLINCSGGCPECSPEDHQAECKEKFASSLDCTCVEDVIEVEHTCETHRYCQACQIEKRQKSYPHVNTLKGIHVPSQSDLMAIAAENRASFRSFTARR